MMSNFESHLKEAIDWSATLQMNESTQQISIPRQEESISKTVEENYVTVCWGCGLRLFLPSYAPVFKCGWCGAITNNTLKEHKQPWFDRCSGFRDRVFVLVVICIILSVICGGVWAVHPIFFSTISFSSVFHVITTFILASGTLVNFCMVSIQPAGPPPNILWGNYDVVGKGDLDDYSFCQLCAKPKSPQTHHCRSCKTCVLHMDHHCPFIGNCVGATNHRHFIAFLFFALISDIYVLLMSLYAGLLVWPTLVYVPLGPAFRFGSFDVAYIVKAFVEALMSSSVVLSARAIALVYLIVASFSVAVGIGLLFYQQIQLLYSGQTYIDSLKFRGIGTVEGLPISKGWGNVFRIFGNGHPIFWFLPKRFKSYSLGKKPR